MKTAIDNFAFGIDRASDIHALHEGLVAKVTAIVRIDDLLRFEIIQSVSALDKFVHELTLLGMLEIIIGTRPRTPQFDSFTFSANSVLQFQNTGKIEVLANEITMKHSHVSFQHPDKIAEAIRLISPVALWNKVGAKLSRDPKELKRDVSMIVDRRNKIVHESDLDPSYPSQCWPILPIQAEGARHLIRAVGFAIFDTV